MNLKSVFLKIFLSTCIILLVSMNLKAAATELSLEESRLKTQIQTFLDEIDSPDFTAQVSMDEFIVKAFLIINTRKPDPFEFYYSKSLLTKNQLTRSHFLALLLAGEDNNISWDKCRNLMKDNPLNALKNTADIQQDVQTLKNASRDTIIRTYQKRFKRRKNQTSSSDTSTLLSPTAVGSSTTTSVPDESYTTYFGYLHAHTSYSDGSGTPEEAYQYARDLGKLDFFAVTDHGELLIFWPWEKKWSKIKTAADANDVPGSFVALWGFEWSNPLMGHFNILNTEDYTHCLSTISINDVYDWLAERPDGFGTFNHPGDYDALMIEFWHLESAVPEIVPQMVGIETWNGSNSFGEYFYKNNWALCEYSYLDTGNQNGWLLGALGGQDNHDKSWGTKNQFRTAVLAKNLTRESIIDAYRSRRFYATEDSNLYLDFRCSGYPMGSQISGVPRRFTASASDGSGDTFSEVRFYRNGDLIAIQPVSGNSVSVTFTDNGTTDPAYYYIIIKQNDDNDSDGRNDEAISSPIWVR